MGIREACQLLIVGCFTLGSAAISVTYMWTTVAPGYGWPAALAFSLLAGAVEAAKPFAVRAAFGVQGAKFILPGLLASLVCVTVSASVEYQVMARGRSAFVEAATKPVQAGERETYWRGELEALKGARLPEVLNPLIDAAKTRCRPKGTPSECADLAALKSELAMGARREELEAVVDSMRAERQPAKGTAEALVVADLLALSGVSADVQTIDRMIVPAMVLLLQLAAVFSAALSVPGKTVWTKLPTSDLSPCLETKKTSSEVVETKAFNSSGNGVVSADVQTDPPKPVDDYRMIEEMTRIERLVRQAGGTVEESVRAMGGRFGMGKDRVKLVCARMEVLGLARFRSNGRVSRVELIGERKKVGTDEHGDEALSRRQEVRRVQGL